jgi:hypothetical protein
MYLAVTKIGSDTVGRDIIGSDRIGSDINGNDKAGSYVTLVGKLLH